MITSHCLPSSSPLLFAVDDEEGMRDFITNAARRIGYEAKAIPDAITLFGVLQYDPEVIVLDLAMPNIDGVEVIRELGRRACCARLVLISGFDERLLNSIAHLASSLSLNVMGCLVKPFRSGDLFQLLESKKDPITYHQAADAICFNNQDLRGALYNDELTVHYQPQVSIVDGRWIGIEALVRWMHPVHGALSPGLFIPLMEELGLITKLTQIVLHKTLTDLEFLNDLDFQGTVSINLPAGALENVDFPDLLARNIDMDGIPHGRITFELTETSLAANPAYAADILARLRLKGFMLAIDDFGTGYSSLEALHKLPFSELKIDMHFVQSAHSDHVARAIVEHSIALGRQLKMNIVAEGVETPEQWQWLAGLGCDVAQGYLISRPLPAKALSEWATNWQAPSTTLHC